MPIWLKLMTQFAFETGLSTMQGAYRWIVSHCLAHWQSLEPETTHLGV